VRTWPDWLSPLPRVAASATVPSTSGTATASRRRRRRHRASVVSVREHRAVPGSVIVVAIVRCKEAEHVTGAAEGQPVAGEAVLQFDVGQNDR
jgi:hypothetical protein